MTSVDITDYGVFGLPPLKMPGAWLEYPVCEPSDDSRVATLPTKPVTVRELIERLSAFPPEMRVVVRGYEAGLGDIDDLIPTEAIVGYHGYEPGVYSPHECVEYYTNENCLPVETMLLIERA